MGAKLPDEHADTGRAEVSAGAARDERIPADSDNDANTSAREEA